MKVVVTNRALSKNAGLRSELLKHFPDTKFNIELHKFSGQELVDFVNDAEALIVGLELVDEFLLKQCKNLKVISKYGVGVDNIDFDVCEKYNVAVKWTPGVNKRSVSEMALSFMLSLSHNIYVTSNQLKNGEWNKSGGFQLTGKKIGIIGVGNIGKELVKLLSPFDCDIFVNDVIEQSDYYKTNNLIEVTKEELLKKCDVITIHTPLNKEMIGFFNRKTFSLLKKSSLLINTARGPIINLNDLKWALKNKIIAGAAIDVYSEEPPQDQELLAIPNLINTPHIAGNTEEAVWAMGIAAIENLKEYIL